MKRFILPLVLLIAFLLRVLLIDKIPVGFTPDEASFGYDAYSILHTGKDQWGNFLPITLKSFGDYKSPIYSYLTIPFVGLFGLTKFAVRLPNAIIGVFAVYVLYLLMKEILGRLNIKNQWFMYLAPILLAVSPWHIMMSRGAFEANLVTLLIPLGIYLFLINKYSFSALVFGLSLFSYHSAKLISPIIFIGLVIIMGMKEVKPKIIFILFFILLVVANMAGGGKRIAERSITAGALEDAAATRINLIQHGMNPTLARILHNKYQLTLSRFIYNSKQYFSFKFLFTNGPSETTYGMLPGVGVLYIFEGILLLGLIPIFSIRKFRNVTALVFLWLLLSSVPAALATGVGYSANRAETMIPAIQILSTLGAYGWFTFVSKNTKKATVFIGIVLILFSLFEIGRVLSKYFIDSPKIAGQGMLSGNLEMAQWITKNGIENMTISRTISEPHIYIAFAKKWDPGDYQKATRSWKLETWVDQIPSYKLGDFTFQNEKINIGRPNDFKVKKNPDNIFFYPDGSKAIYVYKQI